MFTVLLPPENRSPPTQGAKSCLRVISRVGGAGPSKQRSRDEAATECHPLTDSTRESHASAVSISLSCKSF